MQTGSQGRRRERALRALILQCCETEDLGLYNDVPTDLGVRHDYVRAYREPIPAVTDYDVLMIGGTPDAGGGGAGVGGKAGRGVHRFT